MRSFRLLWLLPLLAIIGISCKENSVPGPTVSAPGQFTLTEARRARQVQLTQKMSAPQGYPKQAPPGAEVVYYESAGRKLMAWLGQPKGKGPHPGMLFIHGGFALNDEDFESIEPFLDAGYVVLLPSWRGENGNPGYFEFCYGELDDANAALEYLIKLPDVDAKRVFAFGHSSTGGTLALLLAETTDKLKAVVASSPLPDMRSIVEASNEAPIQNVTQPFDWRDPVEMDLRSPARHVNELRCPAYIYVGEREDQPFIVQANTMEKEAKKLGKQVTAEYFPGADHYTARNRAVLKAIIELRKLD